MRRMQSKRYPCYLKKSALRLKNTQPCAATRAQDKTMA